MRPTWDGALRGGRCCADRRMPRVTYWNCIHLSVGVTTPVMSSSSPRHPAGRGALTCADAGIFHRVAIPRPIPPLKRVDICPGSLRCDLLVPQLPSVEKSMKRACTKGLPQDRPHLCKSALFLSPLFFSQLSQMRSEGTNVPHFLHLTMSRTFALEYPEDTQGTGKAGCT